MIIVMLLGWWYGRGWAWAISSVFGKVRDINETFSIPILLKTWFSPWKQITTQATFRNFFQAAIDNLVSRFVGATVRSGMIFGGLISSILVSAFGLLTIIAWPVIPLLLVIFPILFVSGGL